MNDERTEYREAIEQLQEAFRPYSWFQLDEVWGLPIGIVALAAAYPSHVRLVAQLRAGPEFAELTTDAERRAHLFEVAQRLVATVEELGWSSREGPNIELIGRKHRNPDTDEWYTLHEGRVELELAHPARLPRSVR